MKCDCEVCRNVPTDEQVARAKAYWAGKVEENAAYLSYVELAVAVSARPELKAVSREAILAPSRRTNEQ